MCLRSMGILCFLHDGAESLAEARYIRLVKEFGLFVYPACSVPILCLLVAHQPACQAISSSRTHCATPPLLPTT
jgi:hypothetical protein